MRFDNPGRMPQLGMEFLIRAFVVTVLASASAVFAPWTVMAAEPTTDLTPAVASSFVRLALGCLEKEYPNKLDHVINDAGEVRGPRELHPAFYGCFDWHSAVHGHWMLVRLLKRFPELPEAQDIRRVLERNLTAENIAMELRYLEQPNRKSFERTYGWAWLLKLSAELRTSDDRQLQRWAGYLSPLAQAIAARYRDFLPRQAYPIRTGVHPNTAFAIALALDYADAWQREDFGLFLKERAKSYYERDQAYPAEWEPGGEDFISPALMEAELMRRVLSRAKFNKWFSTFLPALASHGYPSLLEPARVTDRGDPKLVHLDGLNLSRAWCMQGIAGALPAYHPGKKMLREAARRHLSATLPHIASGNYEGEHWLATFVVLALGG
jgi:hypothetical protein